MTVTIDSVLHLSAIAAGLWLILLWLHSRLLHRPADLRAKMATGAFTGLVLALPMGGVTLGCWIQSFHPNPSIPGIGLILAALAHRLFGCVLLKSADLRALLLFGTLVGSVLYLHPLWPNAADLYYWGWLDRPAIGTLAGVCVAYLILGNRVGVLLLLSLVAYAFRALESENAWDYVIDPVTWIVCLALQTSWLLRTTWRGFGQARRSWVVTRPRVEEIYGPVAPTLVENAPRTPGAPPR